MRSMAWRHLLLVAALAAADTVWVTEVLAASAFDGGWNVAITTDSGDCGPARIGVVIANGVLQYAGDSSVTVSGRVARSGAVGVSVASGDRTANGRGRLASNAGTGTWRGTGSTSNCTGRWSAVRQ